MGTIWIYSISSDIGTALAVRRLNSGWNVAGTYRTWSQQLRELKEKGAKLVQMDATDPDSVAAASGCLVASVGRFDECVVALGTLEPIGQFHETPWHEWATSISVNFTAQLHATHAALAFRKRGALVLFFAGGGTNSATERMSAYTISKVALIKMTELLQVEIENTRFCILGPGWVDTKIHQEVLNAGKRSGEHLSVTAARIASQDFVPMESVLDCIDWISTQPAEVIGGRNFSVAYDDWRSEEFAGMLRADNELGRLRRYGNQVLNRSV